MEDGSYSIPFLPPGNYRVVVQKQGFRTVNQENVRLEVNQTARVDINLERAALSLGADRLTVFRRIVLPLVLPALLSAALFSFLASFDELVISLFLSGVASETLPVRIWNSLRMEIEPTIAAVSAFLIGITTIVLLADAAVKRLLARRAAG